MIKLTPCTGRMRALQRIVSRATMSVGRVSEGLTATPIFYRVHKPRSNRACPLCNTDIIGSRQGCNICSPQRTTDSAWTVRGGPVWTRSVAKKQQQQLQNRRHKKEEEEMRVLFICGMDARHDTEFFSHLVDHLVNLGCTVCSFDNRGVGRSYIPQALSDFSTTAMCEDTLELLDTLGWQSAHVIGMSMGGMIGSKLAAAAPERVASLTILNSTMAGKHMALSLLSSPLLALKGMAFAPMAMRIQANLQCNFSPAYLASPCDDSGETHLVAMTRVTLEAIMKLPADAVEPLERGATSGHKGQLRAVMTHRLSDAEAAVVQSAGIPRQVLSGKYDPIAGQRYAQWLADHLDCPLLTMDAGHSGITMEAVGEVSAALERIILGKQRSSEEHWAVMAAEVEQRTQSTVMMRDLVMQYA